MAPGRASAALVVGGTGMLAGATLEIAARGYRTVVLGDG